MAEIKLRRKIVYSGEVFASFMAKGWNCTELANVLRSCREVDAVEVVRCKDCKYRGNEVHCPMLFVEVSEFDDGGGNMVNDYTDHDNTTDDGFCDRGERREGE